MQSPSSLAGTALAALLVAIFFHVAADAAAYSAVSFASASTRSALAAFGGAGAPGPEPKTWSMVLAGLGLMGAVAWRRRSRA